MRKILSLVLVLALVLGSFAFTFAATPSDVVGEDSEDAVNVLMELGVINGYPDGSYKPAGIVTRGEMAKIVICALGLEDYAAGSSSFSDMAGHWSDKYVAYAVSLGIINGYPDGTFKADNTVSYDEAAKMLVAALGYTEDSLVGAWPVNYVTKAKVLGILDDIKAGSAGANRGDIAIMTYQTLDLPIGKTNNDGDWIASIPADDMLTRLGAVLAAGGAAFVLTDTHADDAIADVRELVGAFVKAYVNDDGEIIAIKSVESEFLIGEFDLATVAAATTFETDDEEYDIIGFASLVAAGYYTNGESDPLGFGVADVAAATEYKIAVDVSGVKINDIYSVAEWAIDDDFQFEDGYLEDDNIAGNTFKLDDNDDIDMSSFVLLGVDSLEDIEEDDVVYVYLGGTSGDVTKIEVGTETASGEVTRIKGSEYTIGGKVYEFSTAPGVIGTTPGIDDEIEMTLDYAGDIYDYEVISGEADLYGIVLRTGVASEDPGDLGASDAEIELFMADGTKKTFTVDYDKFALNADGTPGDNVIPATVYDQNVAPNLVGGVLVSDDVWLLAAGDVVEYALNKDGEVESLEWVVDASAVGALAEKRADVTWVGAAADLTAKGYYQAFSVASDALIMTYDSGAGFTTDEDDYGIAQRANLL
ncbi:MAG: S-layer homology domain-containing protein, partial [Clostridiaceae bacterium]|nr:S-layer homology domain-containing protein [Clostridiaceae bacterium]